MKLTLLGGGGFRVPLMFRTLLRDESDQRVTELRLWDTDAERLAVIRSILGAMASGHPKAPVVRVAGDLDDAVAGADFVFSAIRAGAPRAGRRRRPSPTAAVSSARRPLASAAWTTRCGASPLRCTSRNRSPGWPPAPI